MLKILSDLMKLWYSLQDLKQKVKDEVKNINVITKQDIQKKNYSSVEEVLKIFAFCSNR